MGGAQFPYISYAMTFPLFLLNLHPENPPLPSSIDISSPSDRIGFTDQTQFDVCALNKEENMIHKEIS